MIRLLASDLDGTLVYKNSLTDKNRKAILELNKQKDIFAVSTGRGYNGVAFLEEEYNIKIDYYVLLNGAMILDSSKNKVKHHVIKKNTINKVIEKYYEDKMAISLESGYCTYLLNDIDDFSFSNIKKVNSLDEINEEISLISIYLPKHTLFEVEKIKDSINENYGDELIAYRNSNYIDVVPVGCSKGDGVVYVANSAKVDSKNIYTIGDSWNDISMFKVTNNSFTFYHSEDELKKHVNYLVNSVDECINNFIKISEEN